MGHGKDDDEVSVCDQGLESKVALGIWFQKWAGWRQEDLATSHRLTMTII